MAIYHYQIQFKDIQERLVSIDIYNQDLQEGDLVTLTPAAHPFVTTEDDDYDPMMPIRSTTAQISVVCTHDQIISIRDNIQWMVRVSRAGTLMWLGYLRAEMGDMDFSSVPDVITYQADDMLGILKYQQKTLPDASKESLKNMLQRTYGWIDNSIPVKDTTKKPWDTLTDLYVSPFVWSERDNDEDGIPVNVSETRYNVESNIVEFLGVVARYYNGSYYLGSLYGTKFYNGSTHDELTLTPIDGNTLQWTGFCSVKWEQGIGLVRVNSGGKFVDSVDMPDTNGDNIRITSMGYIPPQTARQTSQGAYNAYARYLEAKSGHGITMVTQSTGDPGNLWSKIGVQLVDTDIWETDEWKYDFSFSRYYLFCGTCLNKNGTTTSMPTFSADSRYEEEAVSNSIALLQAGLTTPLLTLSSVVPVYADNGGITIDFEYQVPTMSDVTDNNNHYRKVTEWGNSQDFSPFTRALCSLQFGDMYWNGQSWQSSSCTFFYMLNFSTLDPVIKDLEMLFEGKKLGMPITGIMGGVLTFKFYGAYTRYDSTSQQGDYTIYTCTWKPEDLIKLSTVDVSYNPPLDYLHEDDSDMLTLSKRTEAFPKDNAKTVDLPLCSAAATKLNWGYVYYSSDQVVSEMLWPKLRQSWIPEKLVLHKNVLALSRIRRLATLAAKCEYDHIPFQRISYVDRTWYPLAVKTDWRDCESEILVADITDIMAELPEVGTDEESVGGQYDITVSASGQMVTLTLEQALDEDVTVEWSTTSNSGTVVIQAEETTVTFDAQETIQDPRDIGFLATSEHYTFNIVWDEL